MSFAAGDWAWEQRCPSSAAKSVLTCLAWFANKIGESAFPSIETITRRTQLDERTIRKALGKLIAANLITAHPRKAENGKQLSTEYRLTMREPTPAKMQEQEDGRGDNLAPTKMQDTPNFAPDSAKMGGNPVLEPRKEGTSLRDEAPASPPPRKPPRRDDLFGEGIALCLSLDGCKDEADARTILASLRRAKRSDADILAALREAQDAKPIDPKTWLMKVSAPKDWLAKVNEELGLPADGLELPSLADILAERARAAA